MSKMPTSHNITFIKTEDPAQGVTRFGGQPDWLEAATWPVSKKLQKPMRFIGQVRLDFGPVADLAPQMAYIFMTDDDEYVDGGWKPEGGENAVILQPAGPPLCPTTEQDTGPSVYATKNGARTKEQFQWQVSLTDHQEPDCFQAEQQWELEDEALDSLGAVKVGGVPAWLQNTEWPGSGIWHLVLQFDEYDVPFSVNFGGGRGFIFISKDGKQARMLYQS